MRSIAGIIGFLVFLAIVWFAAGNYIDGIKTNAAKCTETRAVLGLCTK